MALSSEIKDLIASGNYSLEVVGTAGINQSFYLVDGKTSKKVAIFKSQVAELGCATRSRLGIRQGELCLTEAAAMEIAQNAEGKKLLSFPPTILLKVMGKIPDVRHHQDESEKLKFEKSEENLVGSFQKYVEINPSTIMDLEKIHPSGVEKIALFDLLSLNTDRNRNNYLISDTGELIPIDHGCCFPGGFQDSCSFIWLEHPAVDLPLSQELLDYARSLNAKQIIEDMKSYFSQPHLASLAEFQKVSYPTDKDPKFIEKRLKSLYFAIRVVQTGLERGLNLKQLGLLFSYTGKFGEREISNQSKEILTALFGPSGPEVNMTSGRIFEETWKKINSLIDQSEPIEEFIEKEIEIFLNRFEKVWIRMFKTTEDLIGMAVDTKAEGKLSEFFKTSDGKSLFVLIQQEKLYEKISQLKKSESNLDAI